MWSLWVPNDRVSLFYKDVLDAKALSFALCLQASLIFVPELLAAGTYGLEVGEVFKGDRISIELRQFVAALDHLQRTVAGVCAFKCNPDTKIEILRSRRKVRRISVYRLS